MKAMKSEYGKKEQKFSIRNNRLKVKEAARDEKSLEKTCPCQIK